LEIQLHQHDQKHALPHYRRWSYGENGKMIDRFSFSFLGGENKASRLSLPSIISTVAAIAYRQIGKSCLYSTTFLLQLNHFTTDEERKRLFLRERFWLLVIDAIG
jgi:hypothetical protein